MADYVDESDDGSSVSSGRQQKEDPSYRSSSPSQRRNSYIWEYFRPVKGREGTSSFECVVCNACVGNNPSNLARHLTNSHSINKPNETLENGGRGRPCHSFIWKYCSKDDPKHVRCHLCNKVLFFGSGNTSNITKHLRRRHKNMLEKKEFEGRRYNMDETSEATAAIEQTEGGDCDGTLKHEYVPRERETAQERKERKGVSYVWNFCDKLSRNTVRCKLCQKIMSFHGTANVITHLQRKHNIQGKVDENTTLEITTVNEDMFADEQMQSQQTEDADNDPNGSWKSKRGAIASSIVWKYCTRIGKDVVRCMFCKKTLSYQGTSNLQRHLHRMHGIVTHGRVSKDAPEGQREEQRCIEMNSNFIWDHCSRLVDETKTKCNMCSAVFESDDLDNITKHLTVTHAIKPHRPGKKRKRKPVSDDDSSNEFEDDFNMDSSWGNGDDVTYEPSAINEANIKKDETFYDDIIEEVHDFNEEDPVDPTVMQDLPIINPLSPQTSHEGDRNGSLTAKQRENNFYHSKTMQKLAEDRMRQETEYFREKAGFYRMQKYLTALQAKKVRMELDQFAAGGEGNAINGVVEENLQYAMVDVSDANIHNL